MFDPDKPIECLDEEDCKRKDKLRRWGYSKKLGEAILKYDGDESLVIGLEGQWGQGKTSIINMALTHVKSSGNEENEPIVLVFNPWYFSNQNQLIQKFFDEFKIVLNNFDDTDLKSKIDSLVNCLIPPIIGLASVVDPVRTEALIHNAQYFEGVQSPEETLEDIKKDINELILKKIKRQIIIVIDDIDRLTPLEIRQIFKLVKLIADFPKTVYILSFDREVVVKALINKDLNLGEQYLQKIIQIPFEVPKINKVDIEEVLFQQIDEIIVDSDNFDQTYWWNLYHSALKYFFTNLRDVKLYINTLKFNYEIIKGEVNTADFLAITAIQIFEKDIYKDIRNNKNLFAGTFNSNSTNLNSRKKQDQSRFDEIIKKANTPNIKEPFQEFLSYLFPRLNAVYGNTHYGNEWLSVWRKNVRICSPDIFDAYFGLSIPKNEVSQTEIKAIISFSKDVNLLSDSLLNLGDRIVRFLERFEDYTGDFPEENIENMITVLMDIGDKFPDKKTEFFGYDTSMRILRIMHQLIFRFPNCDHRFDILWKAIGSSKNSLYIAVHEVSVEDQVHGKYDLAELPSPKEEWKVNSEQLEKLEQLVCKKIHEWADEGRLAKHDKLTQILFDWDRWEHKNAIRYTNQIIDSDNGLINFITHFLEKSSMYTITDKVSRPTWIMSLDNISELVELKLIEPRLRNIESSSDFDQLDEYSKHAIRIFLEKFDERN